jgi:hypothetical protein
MVRLLLRRALDSWNRCGDIGLPWFTVPFVDPAGAEVIVCEPDETRVLELRSLPTPFSSYRFTGLLYDEIGGDAVPQINRVFLSPLSSLSPLSPGDSREPVNLLPRGIGPWVSLSSFSAVIPGASRVVFEAVDVVHPKKIMITLRAIPGDSVRGRNAPPTLQNSVAFRLYAAAIPIPQHQEKT